MLPGLSMAAASGSFPSAADSGQISYSVSGVTVGTPSDQQVDNTHILREYAGKVDSYNIRVTGSFVYSGAAGPGGTTYNCEVGLFMVPDWSYDLGDQLGDEFYVTDQYSGSVPFDIWLNVPQDQSQVQVKMMMTLNYGNMQTRDVDVVLTLDNPYYGTGATPPAGSGPASTEAGTGMLPLIGAGAFVCLYAIIRMGKK